MSPTTLPRPPTASKHISKIHILLIRQILKRMNISLIIRLSHTRSGSSIALLVQARQVESQENDDEEQEDIATHVRAESDEIAGLVVVAEDLGALGC
jgi:hypothetical protein